MATVVLAGGGTAGHVEPALAVARQWKISHPNDRLIFLGTTTGLENILVPAARFELHLIPRVRISRRPAPSWLKIPFDLISSVRASKKVIMSADVVIGFGGYVSAPAYIAARLSGTPIVIHEANAKPGWANRLGATFSQHLAVANPVNSGKFEHALLTGLPLRSDVAQGFMESQSDWAVARRAAKLRLGFPAAAPLIFVMGGSQGSVAINKVIEESVDMFNEKGLSVLHSVGKLNVLPLANGGYRPVAYVDAMADVYLAADLIIGRSGAVTCSEFRALGRYALFVPLPIGNGEQFVNAASLVAENRAEVIAQKDFTTDFLKSHIADLLAKSAASPIQGNGADLHSAEKIVALAEFAMKS
ncbi:MAG: UDP-N-acetylglucosamine--N-acetylmuramyl-(pentapeptide) pyrophosphoryl-undecaprenol N-acetylglucosamine transferase [Actinobacteria bacterium]|nr:UDP-N-acetylglucosamine--N-acetylmuramyl-(pentapeptide) pyrophosphoryl-undecaprenol N-acetylglucosamine transferase [Actinomycetota bacterium]